MRINAIIVTYNGMKWIDKCLKSVLNSSIPLTVIVVDNSSADGTVNFIKENYKEVILIENKENLGFGKANNIGLSLALNEQSEFVFLLNQDAFVEKDTIEKLVIKAIENPEYGILSPIHLNAEGTDLEWYFSHFMGLVNTPKFYSDFVTRKKIKDVYDTKFVNAAAWLLTANVLNDVGGFDPMFFHYGEDNNYCQRIIYHQFKIGVVPDVFIKHDSIRRKESEDYKFSDRFYKEYETNLKVKYANLNSDLKKNAVTFEKNKIIKQFIDNTLNSKFYSLKKYYNLYNLIDNVFVEIVNSREINKKRGRHYL